MRALPVLSTSLALLGVFGAWASANDDAIWSFTSPSSELRDAGIEFDTSFRRDNLNWNIAADPTGLTPPNILSELSWRGLNMFEFQARGHAETRQNVYVKAMVGYGWIVGGTNQDSDYGANDRGDEWSRSNNSANRGEVFDSSLAIGYDFKMEQDAVSLIPLMGVSYNIQRAAITNGNQTISSCVVSGPLAGTNCPPFQAPLGSFEGLASSYRAEWLGPWNGLDANFDVGKFHFGLGGELHWDVQYSGEADWNLRTDLAHPESFHHSATGQGVVANANAAYRWSDRWSWTVRGRWEQWRAGPGVDTANFSDGTSATTRLNVVHWNSLSASVGAAYHF